MAARALPPEYGLRGPIGIGASSQWTQGEDLGALWVRLRYCALGDLDGLCANELLFRGRLGKEMATKVGYQSFNGYVPHSDGTETFEATQSSIGNVVFAKKDGEDTTPFPHAVIELGQTHTPPEDRPTRLEVHHASMVLRFMLLNRHWTDHHTFPVRSQHLTLQMRSAC